MLQSHFGSLPLVMWKHSLIGHVGHVVVTMPTPPAADFMSSSVSVLSVSLLNPSFLVSLFISPPLSVDAFKIIA